MKKQLLAFAIAMLCFGFTQSQTKVPEWKEQKIFHDVMSPAFHPVEKGNYTPLKLKADSLVIVAKLWNAATIPANYKPKETKENLVLLWKKCAALQYAVKENKSDEELKKLITDAHDTFHVIVGECKKDE